MELSRLSKKCQECNHVDSCQNKRMEDSAYIKEKPFEPGMRTTITTFIDGNTSTAYKDEIEKQLTKLLENRLYSQFDV